MADTFDPAEWLAEKSPEVRKPNDPVLDNQPFDPAAYLADRQQEQSQPPAGAPAPVQPQEEPPVMLPAGYLPGATGINPTAIMNTVVKPAMSAAGSYVKSPISVLTDVALTQLGAPPVAAMKKLYDTYQGVKTVASNIGDMLSRLPAATVERITPAVNTFVDALPRNTLSEFKALADRVGIEKAFKEFQLSEKLALNPQVVAAFDEIKGAFPTTMQKVGQVAGPALRGIAKVAGPAGLAYDAYEAYPYLQQANIGERAQAGEIQQQMNQAKLAVLNAPTPKPLTPQEAANLLASGDQRTIDIYGGVQKLTQQAQQAQQARQARQAQARPPSWMDRAMEMANKYQSVNY